MTMPISNARGRGRRGRRNGKGEGDRSGRGNDNDDDDDEGGFNSFRGLGCQAGSLFGRYLSYILNSHLGQMAIESAVTE